MVYRVRVVLFLLRLRGVLSGVFSPSRPSRMEFDAVAMAQETCRYHERATDGNRARMRLHDALFARESLELWEERVLNQSWRQHTSLQRAVATRSEAWARQEERRSAAGPICNADDAAPSKFCCSRLPTAVKQVGTLGRQTGRMP